MATTPATLSAGVKASVPSGLMLTVPRAGFASVALVTVSVSPSASVIDLETFAARDFTPERARGNNVYEAAAKYLTGQAKRGRKAIIAAYTSGSRARLASILGEAARPASRAAHGAPQRGGGFRWSAGR